MRMEGNKRKAVGEEESMLRKTVKYLKTLERTEADKESEETLVELAGDFHLEEVRQGREEEMNYMVKTLDMFDWPEATSKAPRRHGSTE